MKQPNSQHPLDSNHASDHGGDHDRHLKNVTDPLNVIEESVSTTAEPGQPGLVKLPPIKVDSERRGIEIRGLRVVAGDQVLLQDAEAHFPEGEITLVVGPSGVGKSILMRIIAGLIDQAGEGIQYAGNVLVEGKPTKAGSVGVVFQSFALFDELSPKGNLELAHASGGHQSQSVSTDGLLEELRIPVRVPTSRLSGGQRQRLAIARTLAYNSAAILYDEPTSGLDPATGRQVAQLIQKTHQHHRKTSVIVTHDYHSLLSIADRVFLLDPQMKKLRLVPQSEWSQIPQQLESLAQVSRNRDEVNQPVTLSAYLRDRTGMFFSNTTKVVIAGIVGLTGLFPIWKNPIWGLRFFLHYCRLVFGATAWWYLMAAGLISGFVTTYFTFQFLPFASYSEPLLIEDLLTALGYALYRIVVPVLACILVAARCGAAVTADVGGRKFGNQLDALQTFGMAPRFYLLSPILWAFLIGTPLLSMVAFVVARWTSLVTFTLSDPGRGPDFWHLYFHRGLIGMDQFFYNGFGWLIAKLLLCGLGTGMIAYYRGVAPKYSTADVSRAVTSTILWSTLFVLIVHFLFALYEYRDAVPQTA